MKLRVTYNRERRYFGISSSNMNKQLTGSLESYQYDGRESFSITEDVFIRAMNPKATRALKELQNVFKAFELKHQEKADQLNPFSFDAFRDLLEEKKPVRTNDVFSFITAKIEHLKENQRYNTAVTYQNTLKSFQDFTGRNKLNFDNVTKVVLQKYRTWMQTKSKSETTTGIYLRNLRSIFNEAISEGITANYPFSSTLNKNGFRIPEPKGRKMALSTDELKLLFTHELESNDPGRFYFDSWKLLYLMQGINPRDLCLLKHENRLNGSIVFTRSKTKESAVAKIEIPVSDKIQKILDTWGTPPENDIFIWPVITTSDPEKQTKQVAQFVKMINKYVGKVAEALKISQDVTCYTARHTYATMLMRHGAPVALISKSLGHTSTKTTDNYLSSFDIDQMKEWQKKIEDL